MTLDVSYDVAHERVLSLNYCEIFLVLLDFKIFLLVMLQICVLSPGLCFLVVEFVECLYLVCYFPFV